jgi:hypothetical protein
MAIFTTQALPLPVPDGEQCALGTRDLTLNAPVPTASDAPAP